MEEVVQSLKIINEKVDTMCSVSGEIKERSILLSDISKSIEDQEKVLRNNTLTCREICSMLRITEPTLIKRRNQGLILFIKFGKNFYYLMPGTVNTKGGSNVGV
jgi:hypothetical protein